METNLTKPLQIDPRTVHLDISGQFTRQFVVQLPVGVIADDLKEPAIWQQVQGNRHTALQVHDFLYIIGANTAFAVEGRVTTVSAVAAVLAITKIISFPERLTPLFQDENYRVVWSVNGYFVERKTDAVKMGETFGSESLAILHLQRQYHMSIA